MSIFSKGGHCVLDKKIGRQPVERDHAGNIVRRQRDTRTSVGEIFAVVVMVIGTALVVGLNLP